MTKKKISKYLNPLGVPERSGALEKSTKILKSIAIDLHTASFYKEESIYRNNLIKSGFKKLAKLI